MRALLHILPLLCLIPALSRAQVENDNLEDRLPLVLNQPHHSTTVGATVQWHCLNQRLTSSCIKYHNDQWFSLILPDDKPYFINLSGQDCRDIWGVQVLVFSGEPCVPATYQALLCHSDGNTDDAFIRLPPLRPGQEYLVNVDGYLHDLCAFTIELSDTPKGLPLVVEENAGSSLEEAERVVTLQWRLDKSQSENLEHFEIYRSAGNGQPFQLLATLPHQRNAFGEGKRSYVYSDTLYQAEAEYKVVAQAPRDRLLLLQEEIRIDPSLLRQAPENLLNLELDYPEGTDIGVLVYQAENDSLLFTDEFVYRHVTHARRRYYIGDFRATGIRKFRVVVIRKDTWARDERYLNK